MPRLFAAFLAFSALMTVAAPAVAGSSHPALSIGLTQFPANFHPAIDAMSAKSYILSFTRQPFTTYDANWKPVCLLCTELPTRENGRVKDAKLPDGTATLDVTYTIRDGAQWGDGVAITTKDVLFSWKVGKHPQSGYANADQYQKDIADITVADDHTFTIRLGRPQCQYAMINDFYLLPAHIEEPIFDADPAQYRLKSAFETDTINPALYNGPYRVAQISSGASVTLARNKHWNGKPPQFDTITIKSIENTASLEANLLSGQIDMVAGEVGISLEQALALEKRHAGKYNFIYKPGLTYEHITLNLDHPQFRDVRVRQALLMAIDRAEISKKLFDGRQEVASTNVHPLDHWYDAASRTYTYDPAAANKLLDDAGWKPGKDGVREKDGERLTFNFSTTTGNRTRELIQQILLASWQKIGVAARIKNEPARILFGQSLDHRQYDSALFAWMSAPESPPRVNLHTDLIPSEKNGFAGQNFCGYNNPAMNKILDDMDKQCAPDDQKRLWSEMQKLYADDLPELPLFFRAESYILPNTLTGLIPTGHQYPTSLWVTDWQWD